MIIFKYNFIFFLDFIKKKIKSIEENSASPNKKKENMPSTSKFQKNNNSLLGTPTTEKKCLDETKNEKKIEILMDIIKKKDYEIEKLQRLVRSKTQYIETIEVLLFLTEFKLKVLENAEKPKKREF